MEIKSTILIFLVCSTRIQAIPDDRNKLDCCLRNNFSCTQVEKWKYIYHNLNDEIVQKVCTSEDYMVYEAPSKDTSPQIGVIFFNKKVLQIDERKNTLTMLIGLWTFWEDPRIKAANLMLEKSIKMPSIRINKRKVWIPFVFPDSIAVEEVVNIHAPILAFVDMVPGSSINRIILKCNHNRGMDNTSSQNFLQI